jgi:hypothetical protein
MDAGTGCARVEHMTINERERELLIHAIETLLRNSKGGASFPHEIRPASLPEIRRLLTRLKIED